MASVIGGRILSIEVKRDKVDAHTGMNMNVEIVDVSANKDDVTVQYTFTVNYTENVARLKIGGVVTIREADAKKAAEIAKQFKEKDGKKKLPDEFAELVMNHVTYNAGVAGTFVTHLLFLQAPLPLMPIRVQPAASQKAPPALPSGKESAA